MCELCNANERQGLADTLKNYLRPGLRIAVLYANKDTDVEEICIVDDENQTRLTLSHNGPICWENEDYGNVVEVDFQKSKS